MSPTDATPRARLLQTLDTLTVNHNVLDIGINTLLREAGVAKASLYDHFGSKDELIAAWLDRRQVQWFGWFDEHVAKHARRGDARQELDAAFGFLECWLARDDFSGCPFVTVYLQLRDPEHPAGQRSRAYAARLHEFFRARLRRLRARKPGELATALNQLYLGAVVIEQLGSGRQAARAARRSANVLIESALS